MQPLACSFSLHCCLPAVRARPACSLPAAMRRRGCCAAAGWAAMLGSMRRPRCAHRRQAPQDVCRTPSHGKATFSDKAEAPERAHAQAEPYMRQRHREVLLSSCMQRSRGRTGGAAPSAAPCAAWWARQRPGPAARAGSPHGRRSPTGGTAPGAWRATPGRERRTSGFARAWRRCGADRVNSQHARLRKRSAAAPRRALASFRRARWVTARTPERATVRGYTNPGAIGSSVSCRPLAASAPAALAAHSQVYHNLDCAWACIPHSRHEPATGQHKIGLGRVGIGLG